MNNAQKGFTLIELMIVVAIIAILAAIALPTYRYFVVRTHVSEGIVALTHPKAVIGQNILENGSELSANGNCSGFDFNDVQTKVVASMSCNDATGTITMVGTDLAAGVEVTLTPLPPPNPNGPLDWECSSRPEDARYVPANCR